MDLHAYVDAVKAVIAWPRLYEALRDRAGGTGEVVGDPIN